MASQRAVCFITCGREFTGKIPSSYDFSQLVQDWTVVVWKRSGEWRFGCVHGSVCGGGVWEEGDSVSVCGGKVGWRMCV